MALPYLQQISHMGHKIVIDAAIGFEPPSNYSPRRRLTPLTERWEFDTLSSLKRGSLPMDNRRLKQAASY